MMLFAIYILTASSLSAHIFDVSVMRSEVIKSIIENFDLTVPTGTGVVGADGKEYSWHGLGSVIIYLPFYLLANAAGIPPTFFVSILSAFFGAATATLVFLFCLLLGYSRQASVYSAVLYGIGTMAWYYSKDPGDHVLETFFILLAVYAMLRFTMYKTHCDVLASGFSLGIAGLVRPSSFMMIFPLLLMLIMHLTSKYNYCLAIKAITKHFCLFIFPVIPFVGIYLWYNLYRFGSIFEAGYFLIANRIGVDFFQGTPVLSGLAGLLLSPGKGFFYYSPITILFFFSFTAFWRRHMKVAICFICTITIYILFFSKNHFWHGDWAWGPRYLFMLTPFLIIASVEFLQRKLQNHNFLEKTAISCLILTSVFVQIISVSINSYSYFLFLETEKRVKFTIANGVGVQPIKGPVYSTYYDWRLSPILLNCEMLSRILPNMNKISRSYNSNKMNKNKIKITDLPHMNCIDFWWFYIYYYSGNHLIFIIPLILVIFVFITAYKILALIRMLPQTDDKISDLMTSYD
jgi:hypothetical protein